MEENEKKKDEKMPIQAFSFMVEVIREELHDDMFIVRVQGPQGPLVACFGTRKELIQFFDSL